ncbi:MAG: hypothetical protein HQL96_05760 [Magnetococcales bacterium]|nr:hypothetical protein [Magnetococcales bacterium]
MNPPISGKTPTHARRLSSLGLLALLCAPCPGFGQETDQGVRIIQYEPPPAFIITYSWDYAQSPGRFEYAPTDHPQAPQTWIGRPSLSLANDGPTHAPAMTATDPDAPLAPIVVPAVKTFIEIDAVAAPATPAPQP